MRNTVIGAGGWCRSSRFVPFGGGSQRHVVVLAPVAILPNQVRDRPTMVKTKIVRVMSAGLMRPKGESMSEAARAASKPPAGGLVDRTMPDWQQMKVGD